MFAWLKNLASMAIISAPEYKIWSINRLYTVNNRYVDEELGNPFSHLWQRIIDKKEL